MKIFFIFLLLLPLPAFCQVRLGNEVLVQLNFKPLQGKRVGLITNPTGVNSHLVSTIDILTSAEAQAAGVTLTALFAPEHGVRGDVAAGVQFENQRDKSGAMIYSLYGNGYKPKAEMLNDVDVLVFDIQDIGSRSYTFISTLGLAMEAAAENNKEFMVLDRPNPLGGLKVEGGSVKEGFFSFVSKYPIPYIHGLTVGELAKVYHGERMLKGGVQGKLTIIPMAGWSRDMKWDETGLEWVMTSPHIPQAKTAIYYPMTGMVGELQTINIGVGYTLPFEIFATEWITDAEQLAGKLNDLEIEGVIFRPVHIVPYYGSGKGKSIHGVQVHVTDVEQAPLTLIMYYVMQELRVLYPTHSLFAESAADRISMFDKVNGSSELRTKFVTGGYKVSAIEALWHKSSDWFLPIRERYMIY